jgi:hypothetical protein
MNNHIVKSDIITHVIAPSSSSKLNTSSIPVTDIFALPGGIFCTIAAPSESVHPEICEPSGSFKVNSVFARG